MHYIRLDENVGRLKKDDIFPESTIDVKKPKKSLETDLVSMMLSKRLCIEKMYRNRHIEIKLTGFYCGWNM